MRILARNRGRCGLKHGSLCVARGTDADLRDGLRWALPSPSFLANRHPCLARNANILFAARRGGSASPKSRYFAGFWAGARGRLPISANLLSEIFCHLHYSPPRSILKPSGNRRPILKNFNKRTTWDNNSL